MDAAEPAWFNRIFVLMAKLRIILLFFSAIGFAQTEWVSGLPNFPATATEFAGRDKYGNVYAIRNNNFIKFEDSRTYEFKNLDSGKINRVDLTNPLMIVLFYADFNRVIMVDNQLNEIRRIDFNAWPTPLVVTAVGMAAQNQLWIFDALSQRIHLYDQNHKRLRQVSAPVTSVPVYFQSDFNYFQWINATGEWYVCDLFGKITSMGTLPKYNQVQLLADGVAIFSNPEGLYVLKAGSQTPQKVDLVEKSFKKFYYDTQFLTIFTPLGIKNYKITLP